MNTHPVNVEYKGSTLNVALEFTVDLTAISQILFELVQDSDGTVLYKACYVPVTGWENTITATSAKAVKVLVPATITDAAADDLYGFRYQLTIGTETYRSVVEKVLRFEDYD